MFVKSIWTTAVIKEYYIVEQENLLWIKCGLEVDSGWNYVDQNSLRQHLRRFAIGISSIISFATISTKFLCL